MVTFQVTEIRDEWDISKKEEKCWNSRTASAASPRARSAIETVKVKFDNLGLWTCMASDAGYSMYAQWWKNVCQNVCTLLLHPILCVHMCSRSLMTCTKTLHPLKALLDTDSKVYIFIELKHILQTFIDANIFWTSKAKCAD